MAWSWQLNLEHDPLYHIHWSPSFTLRPNQYWRYWYYSASMPLNRLRKKKKTIAKTHQQTIAIEWRRTMYIIHRTFVASSEGEKMNRTYAWKDEVVLNLWQQLNASSKEDSLVLFFNPYQHPTMGCRKLGTSYIRIISRQEFRSILRISLSEVQTGR